MKIAPGLIQLIWTTLLGLVSCDGPKWDYHDPNAWFGKCPIGENQSPIKLSEDFSQKTEGVKRFSFVKYDKPGRRMVVSNNGHTVKFEIAGPHRYKIRNGGLPAKEYDLVQGHFHWGLDNTKGSEHWVNQVQYPMELHLVHFNRDLGKSFVEVVNKQAYNSLAVLGIMFAIQQEDNPKLDPLIKVMEVLKKEKDEIDIVEEFPLSNFLPRNTDMFYRYNGSLTTPACLEIVVWTVFKEPVGISQAQMDKFRQLTRNTHDGTTEPLGDNFRPFQKLNTRVVLDVDTSRKYFGEKEDLCASHAATKTSGATTLWILTISLAWLANQNLH